MPRRWRSSSAMSLTPMAMSLLRVLFRFLSRSRAPNTARAHAGRAERTRAPRSPGQRAGRGPRPRAPAARGEGSSECLVRCVYAQNAQWVRIYGRACECTPRKCAQQVPKMRFAPQPVASAGRMLMWGHSCRHMHACARATGPSTHPSAIFGGRYSVLQTP